MSLKDNNHLPVAPIPEGLSNLIDILKGMRKSSNLTQKDVAVVLGLSRETVLHIENKKHGSMKDLKLLFIHDYLTKCIDKLTPGEEKALATSLLAGVGLDPTRLLK